MFAKFNFTFLCGFLCPQITFGSAAAVVIVDAIRLLYGAMRNLQLVGKLFDFRSNFGSLLTNTTHKARVDVINLELGICFIKIK